MRARLLQTLGTVYERLGLYDEAGELLEEAAELNRRVLPRTNETQIHGLELLAWIAYRREDGARSTELAGEALALRESLVGPDHPAYRNALRLLSEVELRAGNVATAERHALRLLELVEANEPENKVRLQRALTMLKQVHEADGDLQRLRDVETRLAALRE